MLPGFGTTARLESIRRISWEQKASEIQALIGECALSQGGFRMKWGRPEKETHNGPTVSGCLVEHDTLLCGQRIVEQGTRFVGYGVDQDKGWKALQANQGSENHTRGNDPPLRFEEMLLGHCPQPRRPSQRTGGFPL